MKNNSRISLKKRVNNAVLTLRHRILLRQKPSERVSHPVIQNIAHAQSFTELIKSAEVVKRLNSAKIKPYSGTPAEKTRQELRELISARKTANAIMRTHLNSLSARINAYKIKLLSRIEKREIHKSHFKSWYLKPISGELEWGEVKKHFPGDETYMYDHTLIKDIRQVYKFSVQHNPTVRLVGAGLKYPIDPKWLREFDDTEVVQELIHSLDERITVLNKALIKS